MASCEVCYREYLLKVCGHVNVTPAYLMSKTLKMLKRLKMLKIGAIPVKIHQMLTILQNSYCFCTYIMNKQGSYVQFCDVESGTRGVCVMLSFV